jgi:hypothetical protein
VEKKGFTADQSSERSTLILKRLGRGRRTVSPLESTGFHYLKIAFLQKASIFGEMPTVMRE